MGDANEWDGDPEAWDSDTSAWNQSINARTVEDVLIGTTTGVKLFEAAEADLHVQLEKTSLRFGNPKRRSMIDRVWPKIVGRAGDVVTFRFGGQETADGPTTLGPAVDYVIGSGIPIDTFIQGRYLTMLIDSFPTSRWRLGSIDIESRELGGW